MKRVFIFFIMLIVLSVRIYSQITYGQSGLLHTPSADMNEDKTVMLGGNYLNRELTPDIWSYGTYNYYLNATLFPFLEVSYTCTLFKSETVGIDWKTGKGKFTNQDRYFSVKLRLLKEGQLWKNMPAIAIGTSDPYTECGNHINNETGNGYFSRFYATATKHIYIGNNNIGVTMSYLYNKRKDYHLNGPAFGICYNNSNIKDLKFIYEYDTKNMLVGATYFLFNHLLITAIAQQYKYISWGISYHITLK